MYYILILTSPQNNAKEGTFNMRLYLITDGIVKGKILRCVCLYEIYHAFWYILRLFLRFVVYALNEIP